MELALGLGLTWAASLLLFLFADYIALPAFARWVQSNLLGKQMKCEYDKLLLQPSWTVGLLCSLLPQPDKDLQVQGTPVDDGRLPQVDHDGDHDDGFEDD